MKVTPSPFAVRPRASPPLPPALPVEAGATALHVATATAALGAFAAAPVIADELVDQCGEGLATFLDAWGEGKAWPYACAGGAVGVAIGGYHLARAWREGDRAGMRLGVGKVCAAGFGIAAASGAFAAHPALQTGLETARALLDAALTSDPPTPTYTLGLAQPVGGPVTE